MSELTFEKGETLLNPISGGGRIFNTLPDKMASKFRDFSYFYMNYLINKKKFWVFHSDFGCLEGGW